MIDRRLIGIASDPDRLAALMLLNERSAGAGEVAEELEIEAATAGRLLDQMHDAGLIEMVGEALSRGAVEQRYRAAVHVLWDDEDWGALGLEEQKRMTDWIIEMVNADVREAVDSGSFIARHDSHASRTVPLVDEQGWKELRDIHAAALNAVLAVQAASAERLAEKGEAGFPVLSAVLCCELPRRGRRRQLD
ncbi:MAG TPA: ArsR family transcriptional regulator [Solirubrobacterales bacterium]|nr:ArsR family transcriptional regulator [Solirubrobacterales bacterium]